MASRVSVTTLNASTIDILNTIRENLSLEYQDTVPEITKIEDIPKVGEILYGYPALANQFIGALMNRIAAVRIKSAVFNNAYKMLKKGYLEFGETVEEVYVGIAKARVYSAEKAESREFKRTLPDVRTAFHTINWRVQYPITIQLEDLRQAFLSVNGVQDLIAKIVDSVYTGAEYDEFLLFKYLMIKAITKGKMYPVSFDSTDIKNAGIKFRGISNALTFLSDKYTAMQVKASTPKDKQYIFMDADFNAQYDVEVLAQAFNMDKAEYIGKLLLIDDWTTFDNERFAAIMAESENIEEVTTDELALMKDVKAVLVDEEWFQIYDNATVFSEKYVASGMYWNYFYNVWKTVSSSPFSNAVVFVATTTEEPATLTATITDKSTNNGVTVLTFGIDDADTLNHATPIFVQDETLSTEGIAVHRYGAIMIPKGKAATEITVKCSIGDITYTATGTVTASSNVGDKITLNKA